MPRKGENIYKRKDGRWEGRYVKERTTTGKIQYGYIYGKTYTEVKKKLVDLISKREETTIPDKEVKNKESFHTIALEWLNFISPKVKESTLVKYQNLLSAYLLPYFGAKPLSYITNDTVEVYCSYLLADGGKKGTGLSSKTVTDILSVLRNILKFASKTREGFSSDMISVQIKKNTKEMKILSRNEQEQLSNYLYSHLDNRNIGILISLFTGIRLGELCALRWEDISLNEKTIYIHQTMQRIQDKSGAHKKTKVIVTTPKSSCSIRIIPIPDNLITIIQQILTQKEGYFLTGSKEKFIEPRTMQNHFKKVLKESSLQYVNYHCLRHTFATRCIEFGFDVKSLSEILGHVSVTITMNRYVHPSIEVKREQMQKLSSLLAVK